MPPIEKERLEDSIQNELCKLIIKYPNQYDKLVRLTREACEALEREKIVNPNFSTEKLFDFCDSLSNRIKNGALFEHKKLFACLIQDIQKSRNSIYKGITERRVKWKQMNSDLINQILEPSYLLSHRATGFINTEGDIEKAWEAAEEALGINPNQSLALSTKGFILMNYEAYGESDENYKERHQEALGYFQESYGIYQDAITLCNIGLCYLNLNEEKKGIECLKESIEIEFTADAFYNLMISASQNLKALTEMINHLKPFLDEEENCKKIIEYADIEEREGEYEIALEILSYFSLACPDNKEAQERIKKLNAEFF